MSTISFASDSDTSPYQKLEGEFNQAAPIALDKLPTIDQQSHWKCARVSQDRPDLVQAGIVPLHVTAKVVVTPAAPSNGPLFPATPEKDQYYDFVVFVPGGEVGNDNLVEFYQKAKVEITAAPGVIQTSLIDFDHPEKGQGTLSIRTQDNMLFIHQDVPSDASLADYSYCWQL